MAMPKHKHPRDMTEAELARHVATRPASTTAAEWDEISIERIRRSIAAYDAGKETATAAMWDIAHEANLFMTRGLPRLVAAAARRGGDVEKGPIDLHQ